MKGSTPAAPACDATATTPIAFSDCERGMDATSATVLLPGSTDSIQEECPAYDQQTLGFFPDDTRLSGDQSSPSKTLPAIGRFAVQSVLGSGSFGTVYRAYDPLLDRQVAVKVPRFAPDDAMMMDRFLREAKAAAGLRHPNIVTVFESGCTDAGPYIVSEFVDGMPLVDVLKKHPPEIRVAVDWMRQIAEALHYAHTEKIVHRDIKPANIMLSRAGRPQVMDFGLAKRDVDEAASMTVEGTIVGTPAYMAPEQARGAIQEIGPRSDQYSVGVVFYELLCGRTPYKGDVMFILSSVTNLTQSPPSPRSLRSSIPPDLEACCLKAMEKNPQTRYVNLQAFANDLDHWLKGLPLQARPLSVGERLVRWCRMNRLIAGLTGSLAMLIVTAAIIGYILAFQFHGLAEVASDRAREAEKARSSEQAARLAAERILIDTYTENGLTADRSGDPREAVLWFANAVALARNHPLRERHNRIRMQSWLSEIATPVQVFQRPPVWNKTLAYHPSGRMLMAISNNGECALCRIQDGTQLAAPTSQPVSAAAWSPDGRMLSVATPDEVVLFEFLLSGEPDAPVHRELDRWTSTETVNCLRFSDDGKLLIAGGERTVQVRDVSAKLFRTVPRAVGGRVWAAAFDQDGRRFAIRGEDQQVRVFSVEEPAGTEPLLPVQPSASEAHLSPLFLPNDRLVIVDSHQFVRCWDLNRKEVVWEQAAGRVLATAASPNGKWIAVSDNFDAILLDAATGSPVGKKMSHRNLVSDLSFHPDGSLLLTVGIDNTARLFEVPSGQPAGALIPHSDAVHRCVWSPNGETFATVQFDGQLVRVWKRNSVRPERLIPSSAGPPYVRFNDKGDRWLPSGFDTMRDQLELEVLSIATGRHVGRKIVAPGLISDADFVPRTSHIVVVGGGSRDEAAVPVHHQKLEAAGYVRVADAETGMAVFNDVTTLTHPVAVRVDPAGKTAVVLCHLGQLLLLDVTTGRVLSEEHQAFHGQKATHGFVVRDRICFSPDGERFLLWGSGATAEVRLTATGELLFELRHDAHILHDGCFSPDGRVIATCSSDNSVRLWNAATGATRYSPLQHAGWVFNAQFSRDGKRLLTASSDRQARVWNIESGKTIVATREHSDQVFGVTFLPDEETFLASTRDGQLTAWDTTLGKLIAPVRHLPGMVYQLSLQESGSRVIASGRLFPIRDFDWTEWILQPDAQLSREDIQLLGEILTSQRLYEGGVAMSLNTSQWLERWNAFRERHPDHPILKVP